MDDGTDEDVAEDERSEPDPGDDEDRDHEGGKARRGFEVRVHHLCPQRSFVLSALNQRARASCFRMLLRAPAGSPAQQQSSTGAGSLIQPREQQHRAKSQESAAAQAASLRLSHATGPASAAGTAPRRHGRATRTSRGRGPPRPRRGSNARRGGTLPRRRCTCDTRNIRRQSDQAAFVIAQHPTTDRLRDQTA